MNEIKKKVSKILFSLTMVFAMLLTTIPMNAYAEEVKPTSTDTSVAINDTNFPDKNFNDYIKENDTDKDDFLSSEEISNVEIMDVSSKNISSLKGIEYFTALTELKCSDNQIKELDVSNNTALTSLECNSNNLYLLQVPSGMSSSKVSFSDQKNNNIVMSSKGTFKISTLNSNLDVNKISNPSNGVTVNGNRLSGLNIGDTITYDYDCGLDKKLTVSLYVESSIPAIENDVTVNKGTGAAKYEQGVSVAIVADTPASGKQFKEWQVVSGGVTLVDSKSTSTTFIMPDSAVVVTATYEDIPKTAKDRVDEAKPLAETVIAGMTVDNSTTDQMILTAVKSGISTVNDVEVSWKTGSFIITSATKENAGSITGTIVLTSGSETVEVEVNKTIAQLSESDKDRVDEAKPLAETVIAGMTVDNSTTGQTILDAVKSGISSVSGINATWKTTPNITKATSKADGSITGAIVLTCGSETVEVTVNKIINKLPKTDKDKVDEAKLLAQITITGMKASNDTTAENILDQVTTGISSVTGVTVSWKTTPTITKATSQEKGSISGTIILKSGSETVEVTVDKVIDKLLPITNIVDNTTGTKIEYVDGTTFDFGVKFVISSKTKEEMGKYQANVDKVVSGMTIAGLYDIKLEKDGAEIQPDGRLKITLALTDAMKSMTDLQVIYIDDNGEVTILSSQLVDGNLVFLTDHFSYYGVIGKVETTTIQPDSPNNSSSPNTGVTSYTNLYIVMMVLTGGIAGVCLKKKKALSK